MRINALIDLTLVLATTEFSFNLEFLAGKKNVLADYGTRQIPDTDWPVQEDDPLELNNLLPFNSFEVIQFPNIEKRFYSSDDFLEATNLDLNPKEHEDNLVVTIQNKQRILVPISMCRAFFWAAYISLHDGVSNTLKILKEKDFYWPGMDKDIQEFLTLCVCAKNKLEKYKQKAHGKGISASRVLEVLCIDLYKYNSNLYLTFLDLFSNFPYCIQIADAGEGEVKTAFDKFCSI